jgi:hypothetical protein
MNRFRHLLIRWDKKPQNYLAPVNRLGGGLTAANT